MTKWQRELVSRITAGVIGVALLYGGWRCIAAGMELTEDAARRAKVSGSYVNTRKSSGANLPYLLGGVLLIVGFPTTLFSIVPSSALEKLFSPSAPETGDRGMPDD